LNETRSFVQVCDAPHDCSALKQSLAVHAAQAPSLGEESLVASFDGDAVSPLSVGCAASSGAASSFVPPSSAGGCEELEHATRKAATTIRMKHR
jgi:hypothetical protein